MSNERERRYSRLGVCTAVLLLVALPAAGAEDVAGRGPEIGVAVAANFAGTAEQLCRAWFAQRPGRCVITPGASGVLASQAAQGAPFDIFLSADRQRPERLEVDGVAVPGTRFTYAIGRLVLWVPQWHGGADLRAALADAGVKIVAIAKPTAAPYGAAAMETLRSLGLDRDDSRRIVQGENVAQAFQFVATGAADAGFVAASQVLDYEAGTGRKLGGGVIAVDPALHAPIEQQAVLLARARANADARALLEFLKSAEAQRLIESAGYSLPLR
ncbi:MAG: molybdate ABC transporter substrate-binding protein [Steroidobacteraceae bacterium]